MSKKTIISNKTFMAERSLYLIRDALIENCRFMGEEDGESVLKEGKRFEVRNSSFDLRYPLWHADEFVIEDCAFLSNARAPFWYCANGRITKTKINSIKALRECEHIEIDTLTAASDEFGWRSRNIDLVSSSLESSYAFFEGRGLHLDKVAFKGKYSFQYVENLRIENSYLDTKDAFWHAKGVVVENSILKGEYLAWYSEDVTLINCKIIGTQPFCYCKRLKLINCEMEGTDFALENSEVEATIKGKVLSIKNPRFGRIETEELGELVIDENPYPKNGEVYVSGKKIYPAD